MLVHKDSWVGTLDRVMSSHATHDPHRDTHDDAADADAPEGVILERAAEIEAYLAILTDEPRDAVLARFDIDEERWCNARKVWTERIEAEVMRAAAPGQRIPTEEKYQLSIRYSVAYSKAAESAREDAAPSVRPDAPPAAPATMGTALGSNRVLRLGSSHG